MKLSQFKTLIREEVKKVLNEAKTIPSTYDFNNPGNEWKSILTKAMTRFNAYPKNPKVIKDTTKLITAVYELGFKKIGLNRRKGSAETLANNLIKYDGIMKKSLDDLIAYIKNDIDPEALPNWANYGTKKGFKAGKMLRITPQTKLKVGDEVVAIKSTEFATIIKIEGDTFLLSFAADYADDKPVKKKRDILEDYYLLMKK